MNAPGNEPAKTIFWIGASTVGRIGSAASGIRTLVVSDDGTASLGPVIDVGPNPMFLAQREGVLAVAHEVADGAVSLWRERGDELVPHADPVGTGAAGPCHVAFVAGRLWTAQYAGGAVSVHDAASGRRIALRPFADCAGATPRQLMPHPHHIVEDPDRDRILVPDLGADRIRVIAGDDDPFSSEHSGANDIVLHPGAGPRHLVIAGRLALVANELDRSLSTVDLDTGTEIDVLALPGSAPEGAFGLSAIRRTAAEVVVVADRAFGRLHAIGFDPATGRIRGEIGAVDCGGEHPRDMELTADGRHLVVANQASDMIAIVTVGSDGLPGEVVSSVPTAAPACVLRVAPST